MTANFNDVAINIIQDKIFSYAMASGRFSTVNGHEPKVAPPDRAPSCAVWMQSLKPVGRLSGLSATSGVIVYQVRVYCSFLSEPQDMIDPQLMAAATDFMGTLSGDFEFGAQANVYAVDLLGITGNMLAALAGYVEIDRHMYRVMTVTVPVIINDMFTQVV